MDEEKLDDIKTLKAEREEVHISDVQQEKLRKEVKKILEHREKKEKQMRRAEMEHFYELGLYALSYRITQ